MGFNSAFKGLKMQYCNHTLDAKHRMMDNHTFIQNNITVAYPSLLTVLNPIRSTSVGKWKYYAEEG